MVLSKFICMCVGEFFEGSRMLEDIEDVGVGMSVLVGWIMVLVVCVMVVGML